MIITDIDLLRKRNEKARPEEVPEIVKKLESSLLSSRIPGVGLAAPQIGINKRVAIIRLFKNGIEERLNLVNPKIVDRDQAFINKGEACLSLPGQVVNTQRYNEVVIVDDLHPSGLVLVGNVAVVVSHEIDHLDGILMIDRVVGKNKVGRNDPCPCGSLDEKGNIKKYKKCHGRS